MCVRLALATTIRNIYTHVALNVPHHLQSYYAYNHACSTLLPFLIQDTIYSHFIFSWFLPTVYISTLLVLYSAAWTTVSPSANVWHGAL